MTHRVRLAGAVALTAAAWFVGCGGDDTDTALSKGGSTSNGGSGGATGGSAGAAIGGSATAGTGGSATAGTGGQHQAGSGGTSAGSGSTSGGAGGEGGSSPELCDDDASAGSGGSAEGGAGGAGFVGTAFVLLDNVVIENAAESTVAEWQFSDAAALEDSTSHVPDKWTRPSWNAIASDAEAHNTFFACGLDDLASGSMRNRVPFSDDGQWYEVRVPFAAVDYSGHHVSASVKLVAGGCNDGPVLAELYVVSASDGNPSHNGDPVDLTLGEWEALTLEIPDTAPFEETDTLGLRLHTHACNQ